MGAVFGLFAGFYYWTPKIVGKIFSELLGKIHFWTLFIGVNFDYFFQIKKLMILKYYNLFKFIKNIQIKGRSLPAESSFRLSKREIYRLSQPRTHYSLWASTVLTKVQPGSHLLRSTNNIASFSSIVGEAVEGTELITKLNQKQEENINLEKIKIKFACSASSDIKIEIKGKAGVYMFYNKINGQAYIGSAINLTRRFNSHFFHINKSPLPLYRAIRKYNFNNFIFCILQYCNSDYTVCLNLEQHFLDLYQPVYNILKVAGSSLGSKHKPETIAKLQKLHKGKLHPRFGVAPGPAQRALTSLRLKEFYAKNIHHNKDKKGILAPQFGKGGTPVYCYASNGDYLYFPTVDAAKKHFKVRSTKISTNLYSGKGRPKKVLINSLFWTFRLKPKA